MKKPQSHGSIPVTLTYDSEGNVKLSPPKKVRLSISDDLARVFARATAVNQSDATPLSFTSLLIGLMTGTDVVSEWLRPELNNFGATLEKIAGRRSRTVNESTLRELDGRHLFSELAMSVSARRAIEEAQKIAAALESPSLDIRHLAAAYPILPDWHVEDFKELGIDRLAWCRALGAQMAKLFPAEKWYWGSYADRASPVPLTSFSADVYTEKDLLGIDRTVDALALLMASTRTDTPLSIGVFGPWGSGKSFFMRHVRKRIWGLAEREQSRVKEWVGKRESGKASEDDAPLYYGQVAQIDFNAWHYNEGNLVASLVDHMFRNLRVLPGKHDAELDQRRADVIKKITAAEGLTLAAKEQIEGTEKKIDSARGEVKRATDDISAARKEMAAKAQELVHFTAEAETARKQHELEIDALAKNTASEARAAFEVVFDPFITSQAFARVRKAGEELTAGLKDWRKFASSLFSRRGAIILAVCLGAPLVAWGAKWLDGMATVLTGTLTASAAGFMQIVRFIQERRKEFEAKLEELDRKEAAELKERKRELEQKQATIQSEWDKKISALRAALEQQQSQVKQGEAKVAAAVRGLTDLTAELDRKVQERATAEEELIRLQSELKKLSSALLLEEFIQARSASEDYHKELSFLALVRRDFERLSDLIAAANEEWCSPRSNTPAPLLNRIILYIDDLDRCKVETVIKVLEVVHLLLAFPLFVCVVAVDPRWIEHCLREKNVHLFRDDKDGDDAHVTVGDYLEKIFQIPIWMQPIEHRQRASLVKSLLGTTAAPEPRGAAVSDVAPPLSQEVRLEPEAKVDGFQAAVTKAEATPDPLRITRAEAVFVDRIAPLLSDKPRALKRFVNTYRLLKASLPDIERATFVSDAASSPHKICMTQLAFFTGQPRLAPALARQIALTGQVDTDLETWSKNLSGKNLKPLAQAVKLIPDRPALRLSDFRTWLPETSRYLFHRDD